MTFHTANTVEFLWFEQRLSSGMCHPPSPSVSVHLNDFVLCISSTIEYPDLSSTLIYLLKLHVLGKLFGFTSKRARLRFVIGFLFPKTSLVVLIPLKLSFPKETLLIIMLSPYRASGRSQAVHRFSGPLNLPIAEPFLRLALLAKNRLLPPIGKPSLFFGDGELYKH